MTLDEADKLWCNFEPIEGVLFGYNDSVFIISGEHNGKEASVISLIALEPITYLVELAVDGRDLKIAESNLKRV